MNGGTDLTGMVVLSQPSGEYDRRVVLLTKERGKITCFARGARRQTSALIAATSPFCFGTFTVYEGKSAYTLVRAEISEYFTPLREDLEATYYGLYMLEFASYYGRENLDASEMLNLLYVSLRALEKEHIPNKLVRYIYEIKLMVINGEFPQDVAIDPQFSESARYTMQFIIASPLKSLYTFTVSDAVLHEIARLQDRIRSRTLDRRLNTLEVLEGILG